MKVILCTNYYYPDGMPSFIFYTNKLKQKYCELHDVLFYHNDKQYYPGFHPVWFKLPMIKECFQLCDSEDDWVIWMDADAATVNMQMDIKEYLAKEQKKVLILKDFNNFNAGVFAVPNTQRAKQWINYIDEQRYNQKYRDNGWRQQQVMIDIFNESYSDFYKIPENQVGFNNYPSHILNRFIQGKSWCLHLPSWSLVSRNRWFYYFYSKFCLENKNNDIKIIIPYNEFCDFSQSFFISYDTFNNDNFYTNIIQLINIDMKIIEQSKIIGHCDKRSHFNSIGQIVDSHEILKQFDIILPDVSCVKNILSQFICDDLYNVCNHKNYQEYINQFNNIFTEEEMHILLNYDKISFGGSFITKRDIFMDYQSYLKDKMKKFYQSDIIKRFIKNKENLGSRFQERVLYLYCLKNKLKIFMMS